MRNHMHTLLTGVRSIGWIAVIPAFGLIMTALRLLNAEWERAADWGISVITWFVVIYLVGIITEQRETVRALRARLERRR